MKRFLKEYWLSISVLSFMAIVITCSTNGSNLNKPTNTNESTIVGLADIPNSIASETKDKALDIDIPAPLVNTSEQILYRKSYIVSYNKDTKMPNWVAWHLTSNHTMGEYRRPGNAFHEDFTKAVDGVEVTCALLVITNGIQKLCTSHSYFQMFVLKT